VLAKSVDIESTNRLDSLRRLYEYFVTNILLSVSGEQTEPTIYFLNRHQRSWYIKGCEGEFLASKFMHFIELFA
jgi:hypothetical protein